MNSAADIIERMVAEGMSARLIADVAVALANAVPDGRSTNAIRQARYRDRKASPTVTNRNDVTPALHPTERNETVTNRNETVTSVTPLARVDPNIKLLVPSSITESKKEVEVAQSAPPIPSKEKSTRTKGTRLSPDWQPSEANLAYARSRGVPPKELANEVEKFLNHWLQSSEASAVKRDWDAAWRNWIIRACQYGKWAPLEPVGPEQRGPPQPPEPGLPSDEELRRKYTSNVDRENPKPNDEALFRGRLSVHREGQSDGKVTRFPSQVRDGGMGGLGTVFSRPASGTLPNENGPLEADGNDDHAGAMAAVVRLSLGR